MTATRNRIDETARTAASLAGRTLSLLADMDAFLGYNSAQAIDWGGASKPLNLEEEAVSEGQSPNIQGMDFSRQQVANAIGTFAAIQALMAAGHLGNLQLLASPKG